MLATLLLTAALTAGPPPGDTVVQMRRGDRVVIANLSGELAIESWSRDAIEVVGQEGDAPLAVRRDGSNVRVVNEEGRRGRRRSIEARIRVPSWADVEVAGRSLELDVRGLGGSLTVGNVSGDITIRDVAGRVEVRSIDGDIQIEDVRGGVSASSQSDDVVVVRSSGAIEVHSGSGDVTLAEITSSSVRAETQDGDIDFSGTIQSGGSYGFFVHDGDATIAVPASTDARVRVSTFDGEFESEFPVVVQHFTGGREFDFAIGSGSALIQIEVFDGEIRLLRR